MKWRGRKWKKHEMALKGEKNRSENEKQQRKRQSQKKSSKKEQQWKWRVKGRNEMKQRGVANNGLREIDKSSAKAENVDRRNVSNAKSAVMKEKARPAEEGREKSWAQ